MNWFVRYAAVLGLVLNLLGFVILAVAQSRLFSVVNLWLKTLDFTLETWLEQETPVVRFTGLEKQMAKAVPRSRWLSTVGWILAAVGVAMQLPAAMPR